MKHPGLSKLPTILFLLSCIAVTFQGCKKKGVQLPDFDYTGSMLVNDSISFDIAGIPAGKYQWNFGDGTSSTAVNPVHIYTAAGSYTVTLVANDDIKNTVSKTFTIRWSIYDIEYSGIPRLYDTINFSSTAPAGSTLLWDFGDGTTSTDIAPRHAYSSIPFLRPIMLSPYDRSFIRLPDTVRLIINNDTRHPAIKMLNISPGAERLEGTYHWVNGKYFANYGPLSGSTTIILPDTNFSITAVNDSLITIWGEVLNYSPLRKGYFVKGLSVTCENNKIYFSKTTGGYHYEIISYNTQ